MGDNINWNFLYWDDYEDEGLKEAPKNKKDTFSDSLEDED